MTNPTSAPAGLQTVPREQSNQTAVLLLLRRALITPSCGAGGVLTEPLAERVLRVLRERYGF